MVLPHLSGKISAGAHGYTMGGRCIFRLRCQYSIFTIPQAGHANITHAKYKCSIKDRLWSSFADVAQTALATVINMPAEMQLMNTHLACQLLICVGVECVTYSVEMSARPLARCPDSVNHAHTHHGTQPISTHYEGTPKSVTKQETCNLDCLLLF